MTLEEARANAQAMTGRLRDLLQGSTARTWLEHGRYLREHLSPAQLAVLYSSLLASFRDLGDEVDNGAGDNLLDDLDIVNVAISPRGRAVTDDQKRQIVERILWIWTQPKYKEQRLGQLLRNALSPNESRLGHIEDDDLAEAVERFRLLRGS
jgi:hypothetical protein